MISTTIDINSEIKNIDNIINENYQFIDYPNDILYNEDGSKYAEYVEIKDNENNIKYNIYIVNNNNIVNKIKEIINLKIKDSRKYKILNSIILKCIENKLKNKYKERYKDYSNCIINMKIYLGDKNIFKVILNIELN